MNRLNSGSRNHKKNLTKLFGPNISVIVAQDIENQWGKIFKKNIKDTIKSLFRCETVSTASQSQKGTKWKLKPFFKR